MARFNIINGVRVDFTPAEEQAADQDALTPQRRLDAVPLQSTVLRLRRALRAANRFAAFVTWLQNQPQDMQEYWQLGDGGVIRRADPEVETTRLGLGIGKPIMDALFKAAG